MPAIFSADLWIRGVHCRLKIGELADQSQQPTGLKYTAYLLTHLGQHDLPFAGLDVLNGFENDAQTVTGDVTQRRKIKHKPRGAFSNRTVEKFMQLVGRHFVDIAPGSDNQYLTTGFSMYRHFF